MDVLPQEGTTFPQRSYVWWHKLVDLEPIPDPPPANDLVEPRRPRAPRTLVTCPWCERTLTVTLKRGPGRQNARRGPSEAREVALNQLEHQ